MGLQAGRRQPASIAGLPGRRAKVSVSPPLFCNGPRRGLMGLFVVPTRLFDTPLVRPERPLPSPIRLKPSDVSAPEASGPAPDFPGEPVMPSLVPPAPPFVTTFSAMRVFRRVTVEVDAL